MPPRKAPAAPAAVAVAPVPVDPDAGVTFADHRMAAGMMLRALAGLPPFEALERLRGLYAGLPNGTARRAVLAARLTILRDNLPEPAAAPAPPVAVPAPVVVVPKLPKAGALSTLALEDAARMLMEAATPEGALPIANTKASAPVAVADLFAALAADEDEITPPAAEWDGFDALEGAMAEVATDADPVNPTAEDELPEADAAIEPPPKPTRAKAKSRKGKAADAAGTPATEQAEAGFVATPPKAKAVTLPDLSALDGLSPGTTGFDLGSAFAALSQSDDAPLAPPDDLGRAGVGSFAVPDGAETPESAPGLAPVKPQRAKKGKAGLSEDDIAASLSALIEEGTPAAMAPPTMLAPEVADRLTQLETDFGDELKAKPKRKNPTDLSDVSAAFAALDAGAADGGEG